MKGMLFAGSYERFIFGIERRGSLSDGERVERGASSGPRRCRHLRLRLYPQPALSTPPARADPLVRAWSAAAHQGPVKCIAAAGKWVVTGGGDDQLHLFEVGRAKGGRARPRAGDAQAGGDPPPSRSSAPPLDHGFLVNPGRGAVTTVELHVPTDSPDGAPSHLVSGGEDGALQVWGVGGGWEHARSLLGHKAPVTGTAVHPSGAVALSVALDRRLRLWDLWRGRCTYTAPLGGFGLGGGDDAGAGAGVGAPRGVHFLAGGEAFVVATDRSLVVQATTGERLGALTVADAGPGGGGATTTWRPTASAAAGAAGVAAGGSDGTVRLWDAREGKWHRPAMTLRTGAEGGRARVRGLALPSLGGGSGSGAERSGAPRFVAAASSDGVVRLLDARRAEGGDANATSTAVVGECDTGGARLTCLADGSGAAGAAAAGAAARAAKAAGAAVGGGGGGEARHGPRNDDGIGCRRALTLPQVRRPQQGGRRPHARGGEQTGPGGRCPPGAWPRGSQGRGARNGEAAQGAGGGRGRRRRLGPRARVRVGGRRGGGCRARPGETKDKSNASGGA